METEQQYLAQERADLARKLQEIERAPLAERREARTEWAKALRDPALIRQRVEWLMDGCYGKGAYDRAHEIVKSSARNNKTAQLGILIAALEWQCPSAFAREAWNGLTFEEQLAVTEAIQEAMKL